MLVCYGNLLGKRLETKTIFKNGGDECQAEKLTFVHLSDIHFILAFSNESPFDIDKPVRDAILKDAKNLGSKLGPISGILITGDIAYAGKPGEYKTALDWLAQLTEL